MQVKQLLELGNKKISLFLIMILCNLLEGVQMQELESKGIHGNFKGDSKIFSGNVKVSMMFKSNEWRNFSGALVEFEPSARSAWHTHPQGQTLIVTNGEILTKVPGQKAFIAKKGDVISCPIGVKHFHGATNTSSGAHIALTGEKDGKNVEWFELVSDKEYKEALDEAKK